jgi:peroxiredoxin
MRFPGRSALPRVAVDTPAPDFQLADFKGKMFRLSELRGIKNILLVFNRGFT